MMRTLSGRVYRAGAEIGPDGCRARKCHRKGPLNLILMPPDLLRFSAPKSYGTVFQREAILDLRRTSRCQGRLVCRSQLIVHFCYVASFNGLPICQ